MLVAQIVIVVAICADALLSVFELRSDLVICTGENYFNILTLYILCIVQKLILSWLYKLMAKLRFVFQSSAVIWVESVTDFFFFLGGGGMQVDLRLIISIQIF